MTEKSTVYPPASKISYVKSTSKLSHGVHQDTDYVNLAVESQTDEGVLDLLEKAKARLNIKTEEAE